MAEELPQTTEETAADAPRRDGIKIVAVAQRKSAKLETLCGENGSEQGNSLRCGGAGLGFTGLDQRARIKPNSCSIVGPARR